MLFWKRLGFLRRIEDEEKLPIFAGDFLFLRLHAHPKYYLAMSEFVGTVRTRWDGWCV